MHAYQLKNWLVSQRSNFIIWGNNGNYKVHISRNIDITETFYKLS